MSTTAVSIVLLIFWYFCYTVLKKGIVTAKLFFFLLALMGCAGLFFHPLPLMGLYPDSYDFFNILLFAILMIVGLIPWFGFDKFMKQRWEIQINERYYKLLKSLFFVSIVCSLYAIIYAIPYAVMSYVLGASDVRLLLGTEGELMPKNIYTTLAMGFGAFSPVNVLFVFISLLDKRLSKYTPFLVISSTSYIVTTFASAARDGFILTPLTYLIFFIIFKESINKDKIKILKKYAIIFGVLLLAGFTVITVDRFGFGGGSKDARESLVFGTWGYFYQQPYVFDHRIELATFYGFKRRLLFLDGLFGIKGQEYIASDSPAHQMFGSMYLEFYEISGWGSLIIITIIYIMLFSTIINYHRQKRHVFPMLLAFCIYYYFTIGGMFYFRFGGNMSEFFFYMAILFSSFFAPALLKVRKQYE